jgi:hypothetical protein
MPGQDPYKIQVIAEDPHCPTDGTCFYAGRIPARPGKVQIVAKLIGDPRALAAYAHKVGEGEITIELDEADVARLIG